MSLSRWDRAICKAHHKVVQRVDMEVHNSSSSKVLLDLLTELLFLLSSNSSKQAVHLEHMAIKDHRSTAAVVERNHLFSSQEDTHRCLATSLCPRKGVHPRSHLTMHLHLLPSLACHPSLRNRKVTVDRLKQEAMARLHLSSNISRPILRDLCLLRPILSSRLSSSRS